MRGYLFRRWSSFSADAGASSYSLRLIPPVVCTASDGLKWIVYTGVYEVRSDNNLFLYTWRRHPYSCGPQWCRRTPKQCFFLGVKKKRHPWKFLRFSTFCTWKKKCTWKNLKLHRKVHVKIWFCPWKNPQNTDVKTKWVHMKKKSKKIPVKT